MLRVLSFNISGHNRSALSPATFQLSDKYGSIVSLVKQHNPHLLALQVRQEGQVAPAAQRAGAAIRTWRVWGAMPAAPLCQPTANYRLPLAACRRR